MVGAMSCSITPSRNLSPRRSLPKFLSGGRLANLKSLNAEDEFVRRISIVRIGAADET